MKAPAYKIYLLYSLTVSALFFMAFTVNTLYRIERAHLDALQLVLVGTALELSIFLFEVPTGVVADVFGRRASVIIGIFIIAAAFLMEGLLPIFGTILIAQVLWGLGYTFTSGALSAWITDEIGEENAAAAFMRGTQFEQFGALAGVVAGTLTGMLGINLPILLSGGLLSGFGVFLLFQMPEHGFHSRSREGRDRSGAMLDTLSEGLRLVRSRPALNNLLGIGFFLGLYSEGLDRLWIAHMLDRFNFSGPQPVVWFGVISGVGMLLSAAAAGALEKHTSLRRNLTLAAGLSASILLLLASFLGFILAGNLWLAIGLYWVVTVLRQTSSPMYTALINRRLDPQVRATVLSMSSQVDACGQIAGGPLAGLVARQFSISAGLFTSLGMLAPALGFLPRLLSGELKEEKSRE